MLLLPWNEAYILDSSQFAGVFTNLGSSGFITSTVSEQIVLRTSLKYLLIVSPKCWNLS